MTEIESKHGIVSRQPYELYMSFVDMRNFLQMLPEDKKQDVQADYDTITATVQGFNIGVKVHERVPYSRIELVESVTTAQPGVRTISPASSVSCQGYTFSMPVAITPTVVRPHSRAVRWAIPSAPKARPLTMHGGTDASPMASTIARVRPMNQM